MTFPKIKEILTQDLDILSVVGYQTLFYNTPVKGSYSKAAHLLRATRFANQDIQKLFKDAIRSVSNAREFPFDKCLVRQKTLRHRGIDET